MMAANILCCPYSVSAYTAHTQQEAVNWAREQIGKGLDYDGMYGNQCVDLIKYYYKYLANVETYGNGCDYATNELPSGWSRVYNNYQPGDVAVWKTNYNGSGPNGHVAIITEADASNIKFVNQNYIQTPRCTENRTSIQNISCAIRPDFPSPPPAASDTVAPVIRDVKITNKDGAGYTVVCTVTDNVKVDRVQFPTWTTNNDQDDVQPQWWSNPAASGTKNGDTYTFRVNISDHKGEVGQYATHIYAYDSSGNASDAWKIPLEETFVDNQKPSVTDVRVTEKNESGYTVSCTVTDNVKVDRVQFPTWTIQNGQDDVQPEWWSNPSATGSKSGNTYTFRVNISDHNQETGQYATHIYAYDSYGNAAGPIVVPAADTIVQKKSSPVADTPAPDTGKNESESNKGDSDVGDVETDFWDDNNDGNNGSGTYDDELPVPEITEVGNRNHAVTLTWSCDDSDSIDGYYIYRSKDGKDWRKIANIKDTEIEDYEDKDIKDGDICGYIIRTYAGNEQSENSVPEYTCFLKKVAIKSVKSNASKKMNVKWSTNPKASGYQIRFSTTKSFTKTTTSATTVNSKSRGLKTIKNLKSGKRYYVQVRAFRKYNGDAYYSGWSAAKRVKVKG